MVITTKEAGAGAGEVGGTDTGSVTNSGTSVVYLMPTVLKEKISSHPSSLTSLLVKFWTELSFDADSSAPRDPPSEEIPQVSAK